MATFVAEIGSDSRRQPTLQERHFRAMNTDIGVWLWSQASNAADHLAASEQTFERVEAELSRFRNNSALSRLNARAGAGPQPVSPRFYIVLSLALSAAAESDGLFDPTVLYPLRMAGYDRSFEQIAAQTDEAVVPAPPDETHWGWRNVRLNEEARMVELPAGVGLDLGGIAKGWTVDRVAETLGEVGPALVDAGGDIRSVGMPGGDAWPIAVQDPFDETADLFAVDLKGDAIATSSIGGRRWQRAGQTLHHLIDPRTGRPSDSNLHTVTVIAPTTVEAEVAAKVALILGLESGRRYLEERALPALLIDRSGAHHFVVGFQAYIRHWQD